MATVEEHYSKVLSDVYSWMVGGYEIAIQQNNEFIKKHNLHPKNSGIAVDLGAGCGFQSIPLAQAGYSVTAIDIDPKLLKELKDHSGELDITTIVGDLLNFDNTINDNIELIVCMTDTIAHLESKAKVTSLFHKSFNALAPEGKFILSFRDLTVELSELDRFIPVRSDNNIIFTCFLEYEKETVKVYDIVYKKSEETWKMNKSYYRKLRLSNEWVKEQLLQSGFSKVDSKNENGLFTIVAEK